MCRYRRNCNYCRSWKIIKSGLQTPQPTITHSVLPTKAVSSRPPRRVLVAQVTQSEGCPTVRNIRKITSAKLRRLPFTTTTLDKSIRKEFLSGPNIFSALNQVLNLFTLVAMCFTGVIW